MHLIAYTKGIEFCYFPWVIYQDICHTWWCSDERLVFAILPVLTIMLIFFLLYPLLIFSCTKYHNLVWYICKKRNFVRMQHYSFAIFPFDYGHGVSDHKCLDTPLLRSWPRTESTSLPFPLMLQQRTLFPFLTSPAKRGLGVRDFILWS